MTDLKFQLNQAAKVLRAGGLIIYPTETCYGAGVDATNQAAVDKLLRYKTRREGRPLSVAVSDKTMASKYVKLNTSAINLYKNFLPGPLTVVSAGRHKLAKGVESET
ncbi:MAG: Sua5/YciO/YrdC/YwlC family protein, partial [Patescibacteria group bacterium]|nr:Sua5/YciO/YrdC/YwlC family protein [Candidatus Beckwithbacteria bacterium]MDZ4229056.1 Sua5/YciO/YrdC/YwlC family protein [Patescibacteria group bacterium]